MIVSSQHRPPPGSSTWPLKKNSEESRVTSDLSTALPSILMAKGRTRCSEGRWAQLWSAHLCPFPMPQPPLPGQPPAGQASDWVPAVSFSYSSGGEDGYVRIHYFDPQYFEFEFEA